MAGTGWGVGGGGVVGVVGWLRCSELEEEDGGWRRQMRRH